MLAPNLTPVNACRVCVVELEGSRVLVPSCARKVEDGMQVRINTERVRHSRRMVLELLASSVDLSQAGPDVHRWMASYGVDPQRYRPPGAPAAAGERDRRHAGHHHRPDGSCAETVAQPVKIDNELYVRDYSRCIMCYKCVKACGTDAQFTFAVTAADRGFEHGVHDRDQPLAVVTGASSGIGLQLAKIFAENGFDLLVNAEDEGLGAAAEQLRATGVQIQPVQADLRNYDG